MDTDGDGLSDQDETGTYGTDPNLADTDGDGLSDGAEVTLFGTDPLSVDTDQDGLSDAAEINTHGTNPKLADSDQDGLSDPDEINTHQTNPNQGRRFAPSQSPTWPTRTRTASRTMRRSPSTEPIPKMRIPTRTVSATDMR